VDGTGFYQPAHHVFWFRRSDISGVSSHLAVFAAWCSFSLFRLFAWSGPLAHESCAHKGGEDSEAGGEDDDFGDEVRSDDEEEVGKDDANEGGGTLHQVSGVSVVVGESEVPSFLLRLPRRP